MVAKLIFYFLVFSLTLGQLGKVPLLGQEIYIFDIVALFFSIYGGIVLLSQKKFKIPVAAACFYLFLGVCVVSLLFNSISYTTSQFSEGLNYIFRFFAYLTSAMIVYNLADTDILKTVEIKNAFVFSAVSLSLLGIFQLAFFPDLSNTAFGLGWDPHKNRVYSTFLDPNFLGAYLAVALGIVLPDLFKKKRNRFVVFSTLLLCITIFLTFSRSAWLMTGVIVFVYGVKLYPKLLIVSALVAFLAYFLVPRVQTRIAGITDPSDSAHYRLISWKNSIQIFKESPFLGIGFNLYRYKQLDRGFITYDDLFSHSSAGADSSFLFVLATTGIAGALIYAVSFFVSFYRGDLISKAVLPALLVESFFINSLFYPQVMFLMFVVIFNSLRDN